ncbi:hypothetical protein BASA83_013764 [Batrachochytrium salamandrivorans]|nr:hypothetical protein BASA83_013764 [Batrachochytrium salamandrivorans]
MVEHASCCESPEVVTADDSSSVCAKCGVVIADCILVGGADAGYLESAAHRSEGRTNTATGTTGYNRLTYKHTAPVTGVRLRSWTDGTASLTKLQDSLTNILHGLHLPQLLKGQTMAHFNVAIKGLDIPPGSKAKPCLAVCLYCDAAEQNHQVNVRVVDYAQKLPFFSHIKLHSSHKYLLDILEKVDMLLAVVDRPSLPIAAQTNDLESEIPLQPKEDCGALVSSNAVSRIDDSHVSLLDIHSGSLALTGQTSGTNFNHKQPPAMKQRQLMAVRIQRAKLRISLKSNAGRSGGDESVDAKDELVEALLRGGVADDIYNYKMKRDYNHCFLLLEQLQSARTMTESVLLETAAGWVLDNSRVRLTTDHGCSSSDYCLVRPYTAVHGMVETLVAPMAPMAPTTASTIDTMARKRRRTTSLATDTHPTADETDASRPVCSPASSGALHLARLLESRRDLLLSAITHLITDSNVFPMTYAPSEDNKPQDTTIATVSTASMIDFVTMGELAAMAVSTRFSDPESVADMPVHQLSSPTCSIDLADLFNAQVSNLSSAHPVVLDIWSQILYCREVLVCHVRLCIPANVLSRSQSYFDGLPSVIKIHLRQLGADALVAVWVTNKSKVHDLVKSACFLHGVLICRVDMAQGNRYGEPVIPLEK